jgi:beta-phosphoglucomutase-like phosphatase (HAD superfamily)
LDQYLEIAGISSLVHEATASEDVEQSKPAPDVFEAVLKKMNIKGPDAAAVG